MNSRLNNSLARILIRLYPRPWRDRFGEEFQHFLLDSPGNLSTVINVISAAIYERIFPSQRNAMHTDSHYLRLQSFSVRAPWLVFGLGPLLLLVLLWFVALLMLWSGWMMFYPGTDTPFNHGATQLFSISNLYFQADRLLYFSAPVVTGWALLFLAARLRLKALWPVLGLLAVELIGGLARVYASRTAVPHGIGHISLSLTLGSTMPLIPYSLLHAVVLLFLTATPYFIWQLMHRHSNPCA
jgi:hypothetical protein